jgi:hypothetical protein
MEIRNMKKWFTLVEVAICIVAIGLGGCDADWQKAEKAASEYAGKIPGATGQVSCMKTDSDGDGYCRCTIFRKEKDPLHVECGCQKFCWVCTDGCSGIKHVLRERGY